MDVLLMALFVAGGLHLLKARWQAARVALLGSYLAPLQLEKLMENLTQGYLRALGEADTERRAQIWGLLTSTEETLVAQVERLANALPKDGPEQLRVSMLPLALPFADQLFPRATFDLRAAMQVHAKGIAAVARNDAGRGPRDKAFMLSAELLLLQHTCHWFCKSRTVASARLLARQQTSYEQVLAAVSPATRRAYQQLVGG